MATVTQLLNRISNISGLYKTGEERQLALDALNNAYLDTVMRTECAEKIINTAVSAATVNPGSSLNNDFVLSSFTGGSAPIKIKSIVVNDANAANYPLLQVSEDELLEYRRGYEATAYVRLYSIAGSNIIRFWPTPKSEDIMSLTIIPQPPRLVEALPLAGEETTPSLVPELFHWNVLLPGAMIEAMDKDGDSSRASDWMSRYESGIMRMQEWLNTFGGEPSAVFTPTSTRFVLYPDQRGWN